MQVHTRPKNQGIPALGKAVVNPEGWATVFPEGLLAHPIVFSSHGIRVLRDLPVLLGQRQRGGWTVELHPRREEKR